MRRTVVSLAIAALLATAPGRSRAAEPASCRAPRFSDIGWTDVTATTALTAMLLKDLGYSPAISLLSVPITYESLKSRKIDVFLGNWMPIEAEVRKPYVDGHAVDVLGANLEGAKATLATTEAAYDSGLKSISDIRGFGPALRDRIYGIEPGSGANGHILDLIHDRQYGLQQFQLVESSEQGMLAELERSVREKRPIVFFGWEPHPMNLRFQIKYLDGGDALFGPNYGGATVFTNVRAGYVQECPNVGRLLANLRFTLPMEDEIMNSIMTDHMAPEMAARTWLRAHPEVLDGWLAGVTATDGKSGLDAVKQQLG